MSDLDLDPTQLDRYSRHIIMDDVGPEGQKALLDAEVLVLGAGGLGAPIIQYLAAAGVGRHHRDRRRRRGGAVEPPATSHPRERRRGAQEGRLRRRLRRAAQPDIDVRKHEMRVTADNIEELISGYDFVVDGTDNFATRYLVNDACTLAGVPFSHGSIFFKFEGQVTTFAGGEDSPCYRCLFPEAPPAGMVGSELLDRGRPRRPPGTVGCLQATETVKHIIGEGETLDGSMLFFDALDMEFDKVEIPQARRLPRLR